ncbi:MAG: hypothetical protein F6K40_20215 [Okeania sp. SIO3I5]|uniref:hypothetical protein n=1 Tax=Okeania sp. SIO3I5 TaxID=2607805 RepID=UPI0013BD412B|nr:hypothetical protein [Okeania sp. SIO3I5]NEQ38465.1 hypothetical protein [Okeania sp. SIO3I5]
MQTTTHNYPENFIDILLQPSWDFINGININNPKFAQKYGWVTGARSNHQG